jgi:DNA polymerase III delta subunit
MIIFLFGEDDFRAKKKLNELRDRFAREIDQAGGGFEHLDGEKITLRDINEKAAASSLWAAKRMIVIENIFRNKNKDILTEATEYFREREKRGQPNIIVFLENFIKTKKKFSGAETVKLDLDGREKPLTKAEKNLFEFLNSSTVKQEFKKLSNTELSDWIKKETAARGGQIGAKAVAALITLTAGDSWQIDSEINKLINYKAGQREQQTPLKSPLVKGGEYNAPPLLYKEGQGEVLEISEADVKELVRGHFEENIFALTDAIGARNRALAASLLEEELKSGANEIYLLSMITRQIKIILQVASALSAGSTERKLAGELKLNPYVAQKAAAQARNFPPEKLKKSLSDLIEIDYKIKTGRGEPAVLLGLWLAGI